MKVDKRKDTTRLYRLMLEGKVSTKVYVDAIRHNARLDAHAYRRPRRKR